MNSVAGQDADPVSPTTFAPLRNLTFRSIWIATQVSSLGWLMQTVAISWLMATISTSDLMVALVQASPYLPAFILSVFAGVMADNFSRRRVMFAGRCLMVIASAMLTGSVAFDFVDPWMILGFSFLIACGGALNDPAWQASVGISSRGVKSRLRSPCCQSGSTLSGPSARHLAAWSLPHLDLWRLSP